VTNTFDEQSINDVIDRIASFALVSGYFDEVNGAEPKSSPGTKVTFALWVQNIIPVNSSGLAITSGLFILNGRIYMSMLSKPYELIDPKITTATSYMMASMNTSFQLGGADGVRAIDILGMEGTKLSAQAGYVEIDRQMMRVMTITIPIIINDMWTQSP
jgi:hypothetical protein